MQQYYIRSTTQVVSMQVVLLKDYLLCTCIIQAYAFFTYMQVCILSNILYTYMYIASWILHTDLHTQYLVLYSLVISTYVYVRTVEKNTQTPLCVSSLEHSIYSTLPPDSSGGYTQYTLMGHVLLSEDNRGLVPCRDQAHFEVRYRLDTRKTYQSMLVHSHCFIRPDLTILKYTHGLIHSLTTLGARITYPALPAVYIHVCRYILSRFIRTT